MKIAVLAGGLSTERDVSLITGGGVCRALKEKGHQAVLIDVFMGVPGNVSDIFEREQDTVSMQGSIRIQEPDIEKIKASRTGEPDGFLGENVINICRMADITFMALHGAEGENGKLQATFDILEIPYTGSGYLGSALAMDKGIAKSLLVQAGIPVPKGYMHKKGDAVSGAKLPFPLVVKPCCGGSSVGVSLVEDEAGYEKALAVALSYEDVVLIEECVKGREFSVGVVGGKSVPVIEIIPKDGFYDYETKYQSGMATDVCPAELTPQQTKQMQEWAQQAFTALHLEAYARIDFLMDAAGDMYCLEANTLPGMTPTSLLPQEARAAGIEYSDLCERIIEESLKKYKQSPKGESAP